jgi:hypothetical protein
MLIDPLDRPALGLCNLRQLQVLLNREARNDAAVLWHQADPVLSGLKALHLMQRLVVEPNLPVGERGVVHAGDRPQGRGLARTVPAKKSKDLAFAHIEADALHDVALAVVAVKVPGREEGRSTTAGFLWRNSRRRLADELIFKNGHRCAPPR